MTGGVDGMTNDFSEAMEYYQQALEHKSGSISGRVISAKQAMERCVAASKWQQAYEYADAIIHLIPQLALRSLQIADKQHLLDDLAGFACEAAGVALQAEKGADVALSFLEIGRGLMAGSVEELRINITDLQGAYPELAERFTSLCLDLDPPFDDSLHHRFIMNYSEKRQHTSNDRHQSAGKSFDELIHEIRNRPGFEDFLAPPSTKAAQQAAMKGQIIVINGSYSRCDAIIVEPDRIRSIPLTTLRYQDVWQAVTRWSPDSVEMLAWVWSTITSPILTALGFQSYSGCSTNTWPHIWWVPTGIFSSLPLHASGLYRSDDHDKVSVLDLVVSSYSSSVKAIIYGRRRYSTPSQSAPRPGALLVDMPLTPGSSPLPFTTHEISAIDPICKSMGLNLVHPPERDEETIKAYLSEGNCSIFHFAGHGSTNSRNPLLSSLILGDNGERSPLTALALMEMNIRKQSPFMAYLSACGTGKIRKLNLLDESIHLISGFQLAGFRHVIGTLWEVHDQTCVDMARLVYEGLGKGGLTDDSVCLALHNATRALRDRWLMASKSSLETDPSSAEQRSGLVEAEEKESRKTVSADDENEEDARGTPLWAPYVHFGV